MWCAPGFTALPNPPTHISTLTGLGFVLWCGCWCALAGVLWWGVLVGGAGGGALVGEGGREAACSGGGAGVLAGVLWWAWLVLHREGRRVLWLVGVFWSVKVLRMLWWWCGGVGQLSALCRCSGGGARPAQNGGTPTSAPRPS